MKAKKLLALALTLCLAFSCIAVVPFTATVASADATATANTSAVWIGRSQRFASSGKYDVRSNVMIPLSTTNIGGVDRLGTTVTLRFTCTAKMLSGTKPVVGWIRHNTWSTYKTQQTEPSWPDNTNSTYDATTGLFTCTITASIPSTISSSSGAWGVLTVGNSSLNNDFHADTDWSQEFIMSNPQLYLIEDNETVGSNLVPDFSNHGCGLYSYRGPDASGNGNNAHNNYLVAPCGEWNRDCFDEDYVQYITVDDDYVTADRTYVKTAETDTTREYYTCADFGDNVYFKKVSTVQEVYAKITDINKKSFIVGKMGEADQGNVVSNVYVPINTHKYFVYESIWNSTRESTGNFMVELTANVKQLFGNERPVVSVMYPQNGDSGANICLPRPTLGRGYNGDGNKRFDTQDYSYNPTTGELRALVALEKGQYKQISQNNGAGYYICIGNAEHDWNVGEFSETAFNTGFIISDIKFKIYNDENMTTVIDTDDAPEMVAENIDTDTQRVYLDNSYKKNGTIDVDMTKLPVKTYGAEGSNASNVRTVNRSSCLTAGHTLTHVLATDTTREYWNCATCNKKYADKYASEEIDTPYATKKMIAVKASGSKIGDAFITFNQPNSTGTHYYKFTCDMRVFGDEAPVLSTYQGSWWGMNASQSQPDWCYNDSEANAEGLYTYYDEDSHTYTAIFKIVKSNPATTMSYYNSLTGNYAALALGNVRAIGANGSDGGKSGKAPAYFTSFIFANPEIYELTDVNDETSVTGENLAPAISDKTINFQYGYSTKTTQCWNSENTMADTNNPLAAKQGTWNVLGNTAIVKSMDIPSQDFFDEDQGFNAKMFRLGGSGSNYNGISCETFLEPGETYQFDIDYRNFGSPERIALQASVGGSYLAIKDTATETNPVAYTLTSANVDGAHRSLQFEIPENANTTSGNGNFRFYLGQESALWTSRNTTTVYYANAKLRKVGEGGALGENLLMNGSFDFGTTGDITAQNEAVKLFGWDNESSLTYAKHDLCTIPSGFFTGDIGINNNNNRAVKFNAIDWSYIRTAVDLAPSSVYELSFDYSGTDDDITLGIDAMGDRMSLELISNHSATKFTKTYRITTTANLTYYSGGDCNTTIEFRCPASANGNEYYINNIQLHKVEGGVKVGFNMLGDRNAIYDDSTYPTVTNDFTLETSRQSSTVGNLVHGWWANKTTTGSVVTVSEHLFDYYSPADRITYLVNNLLNKGTGYNPYAQDDGNQYYNPDGVAGTNILDLVRVKKDIVNISDAGGAGAEAATMLNSINNAANTNVSGKTVYYVDPVSGNDSNNGTSTSTPLKTLSKAITKVGSSGTNKAILLKRGTVTRIEAGKESGYVLPAGLTLGAYGTGAKPIVLGSTKNYANSSWTNVTGNIWSCKTTADHDVNTPGTVYFFNSSSETNKTPSLVGRVIKMTGVSNGTRFANYSALEQEGDVYYTTTSYKNSDTVYVYCSQNPATKYGRIEIGEKTTVLDINGDNVTIDNVAVLFTGGHGISASSKTGTTITNCEVAYVGGTPNISGENANETMGNGIQLGQGGTNETVSNCYVHDCYDAGITFQSWSGTYTFSGINFVNNLLENNFYNIEFFTTSTGTLSNINITGNIMRFAGECWSYTQRADTKLRASNICAGAGNYYANTSNLKIQNNIFDCTMCQQILWYWGGVVDSATHVGTTISGNAYYQKAGSLDGRVSRFGNVTGTSYFYAGSQSTLETAIATIDSAPTKVEWVNRCTKF